MLERREAFREDQEDQPKNQKEKYNSTMLSHLRRRVSQDGMSDQDVMSLKQDKKGVLILAKGKLLINYNLMLRDLDFYPEKVSIIGVT